MPVYSLEYYRMLRNPGYSEAIDNQDVGTIWEWIHVWDALATGLLHDHELKETQKEE